MGEGRCVGLLRLLVVRRGGDRQHGERGVGHEAHLPGAHLGARLEAAFGSGPAVVADRHQPDAGEGGCRPIPSMLRNFSRLASGMRLLR